MKTSEPENRHYKSKSGENKLVSRNETNSLYYILRFIKLVVSFDTTISLKLHKEVDELVSRCATNFDWGSLGSIVSTEDLRMMAFYFLDYGAATSFVLKERLKLGKAKLHRYIKQLKLWGFIEPSIKVRSSLGKKGPRCIVWQTPDATIDQIHDAHLLHQRLKSPKFRVAEKVAQLILDEYIEPKGIKEISYKEILDFVDGKCYRFRKADIAELAAQSLHERGIKVWRYGV